jgi:hypothetical protein
MAEKDYGKGPEHYKTRSRRAEARSRQDAIIYHIDRFFDEPASSKTVFGFLGYEGSKEWADKVKLAHRIELPKTIMLKRDWQLETDPRVPMFYCDVRTAKPEKVWSEAADIIEYDSEQSIRRAVRDSEYIAKAAETHGKTEGAAWFFVICTGRGRPGNGEWMSEERSPEAAQWRQRQAMAKDGVLDGVFAFDQVTETLGGAEVAMRSRINLHFGLRKVIKTFHRELGNITIQPLFKEFTRGVDKHGGNRVPFKCAFGFAWKKV